MNNISLNAGGFIGAACGALIGGVVGFLIAADHAQGIGGGFVSGLVAFAIGGNFLWEWLIQKRP